MRLNGDFRGRYEGFQGLDSPMPDRHRFRYRARFGLTAVMWDHLEAGIRLTSSEPVKGQETMGGDLISGNTTFTYNASKKFVYIDLAYAKWTPLHTYSFADTLGIGKFEMPATFTEMVFDPDYTPEGVMNQFTYTLNDFHSIKFNTCWAALSELSASSHDPNLLVLQALWDGIWLRKEGRNVAQTSLGVGFLSIQNTENLGNRDVPNVNVGNSRDELTGRLVYHYNPVVASGSVTYTLESFPYYSGFFPVRVGGEFLHNPAAPSQNTGWCAGVMIGRAGKRRTWELSYRYRYLEADAWYEEFVESDFGAYYHKTPAGWGKKGGCGAGTNVKGHILRAAYSPYDALTMSVTWFLTDRVREDVAQFGDGGTIGRLQVDALVRF